MAKKKTTEPSVDKHQFEGHSIQIRKVEGKEQLWIDGVRRRFFVSDDGYNLDDDAYASPQKSLIEAVKAFINKISAKS